MGFWRKLRSRSKSNLYFALAFLPARRREAFRHVYRFLRAADDASDSGLPPEEARRRLRVFRAEIDAVRGAAPARDFDLSRVHFETILDALEADVEPRRFASLEELERWCEAVSGTLGLLCLEILDARGATAYARDVGVALQLANIVRDMAVDAAAGRVYLPGAPDVSRWSPAVEQAARALADRARALVARARAELDPADRARLLVPEIWADVYLALLDELERARFDVWGRRPYLGRRRKLMLALRRWARERLLFPAVRDRAMNPRHG
jgi:phytoene synthase